MEPPLGNASLAAQSAAQQESAGQAPPHHSHAHHHHHVSRSLRDPAARTKLVVRNILLTRDEFVELLNEQFAGAYGYLQYISAVHEGGVVVRRAYAYVDFLQPESVFQFKRSMAKRVWLDEFNQEQTLAIEYAPNQKVPQQQYNGDDEHPIEEDVEYLAFLEEIQAPVVKLPSAEVQLDQRSALPVGVPAAAATTAATNPAPVSALVASLQAIKLAEEAKKASRRQASKKKRAAKKQAQPGAPTPSQLRKRKKREALKKARAERRAQRQQNQQEAAANRKPPPKPQPFSILLKKSSASDGGVVVSLEQKRR